jgi:hypothetical protein
MSVSLVGVLSLFLVVVTCAPTPVWPLAWNATFIKISGKPDAGPITFGKFYFDISKQAARFDFYEHYPNVDNEQGITCQIFMTATQQFFVDPKKKLCTLAHDGLGVITPSFVDGADYLGSTYLRDVRAERFRVPIPGDPIDYYVRAVDGIPMRTTNQQEDPGATDYVDVLLGPQEAKTLRIPVSCLNPLPRGVGPSCG